MLAIPAVGRVLNKGKSDGRGGGRDDRVRDNRVDCVGRVLRALGVLGVLPLSPAESRILAPPEFGAVHSKGAPLGRKKQHNDKEEEKEKGGTTWGTSG